MDTQEQHLGKIVTTIETLRLQVEDLESSLKQTQQQEGSIEEQYERSLATTLIADLKTLRELPFRCEITEEMDKVFERVSRSIIILKGLSCNVKDDIFRKLILAEINSVMISGDLDYEERVVFAELYTRRTNGPDDEINPYSQKGYARLKRKLGTDNVVSLASLPDQHIHLEDVLLNRFKSLEIDDDIQIQAELQNARLKLIDSLVDTLEKKYEF
jgi:hypothetical protein